MCSLKERMNKEKTADTISSKMKDFLDAAQKIEVETVSERKAEEERDDTLSGLTDTPLVKLINSILQDAVTRRASDILIDPFEDELQIRYRIDGTLHLIKTAGTSLHNGIVGRLKVLSGLDIAEHRLPQDGRFKMELGDGKRIDFRVSILPSIFGERIVMRILDKSSVALEIDRIGLSKEQLSILKNNANKPYGMILACGPTGCGKTTTLYSILKYVSSPKKNITTVEDPIEYQLQGINQVAVQSEIGLSFARCLRSILRQDPDIILIGEIRDFETAEISVKSALTGHLVLSTLHTTTATGAIVRLINMGIEPFLISASCLLVVSQRLVRLLCPDCKSLAPVPDWALKEIDSLKRRIKIDKEPSIFVQKGCNSCQNTGYRGRMGIFEVFQITPSIKELIAKNVPESVLRETACKEDMLISREDAILKMLKGLTSPDEVMRSTMADEAAFV